MLVFIPYIRWGLLPLIYLNTHIHEAMHALATLATGGQVDRIVVFANGEGVTPVLGGMLLPIASAGYLGSAALGAGIIAWCRSAQNAQIIARGLGILLFISMLLWVRGDLVGLISGVFWIAALWFIQGIQNGEHRMLAVQFIGVQQCLNATMSLRDLLILTSRSQVQNDAGLMENATGLPAVVWAICWALIGILAVIAALRSVFKAENQKAASSAGRL